jgi:RNA polymerase sigma factor (sigma-70 family)
MNPGDKSHDGKDGPFDSTHWTVVIAAAGTHSPAAQQALEELCGNYRRPLYAFARRKGLRHEDAEDVTQQFFACRVVTKSVLQGIDPARGRFRTWMLNSFQNFMYNEHAKAQAQKRGGKAQLLSMDAADTSGDALVHPQSDPASEHYYDRVWAETLLNRAMERLRSRYAQKEATVEFEALSPFLPGGQAQPAYADLAPKLGLNEAALKMRVSRLRKELAQAVRAELKRTVSSEPEAEEELGYLLEISRLDLMDS